jgi:hypothetical protein
MLALALALSPFIFVTAEFVVSPRLAVRDSYDFYFPVFEYIGDSLTANLAFPEWFPVGGGVRSGTLQITQFSLAPHRIVGYALYVLTPLSVIAAYKLQYIIAVSLLSLGWWLFLEKLTGSRLAASFGVIMLALGGTGITLHQEQVLSASFLVPWFLLAAWYVDKDRLLVFAIAIMFGLAGTLYYPHIYLISFILLVFICAMVRTRTTISKIRSAFYLSAAPAIFLFLLSVAPLAYFYIAMPELTSPVRTFGGAPMVASTYEEYLRLHANAGPGASAYGIYYLQYLITQFPPRNADVASFFVGRLALIMVLAAFLFDPHKSLLVWILTCLFLLITLGIHSPLPFVEVLFSLSPPIMGTFRQWFHFFPMINFCLSALAAIGIAAAVQRFQGRLGRVGPAILVAVFALQIFELSFYGDRYLARYTIDQRPASLLAAAAGEAPNWGFASNLTTLQYKERAQANQCCVSAMTNKPYLTDDMLSLAGGFDRQLAAVEEMIARGSSVAVTNVPPTVVESLIDASHPGIEAGEPEMKVRYDGADFTLRTDRPALLVMPLNYALGLEARINGDRAEVWRVNGALSGVIVPKGASLAEVRVIPDSYRWIALSQAVCVVLLFGLLAAAAIRS